MSIFSKLFGRNKEEGQTKVGGMEDFMLLIRVYYQAAMAAQLGISNLAALPDLRIFKQTYRVATLNNKLGIAEKKHCRGLIQDIYGISDTFFSEIMMLMGNLMQWKMRLPSFLRGALREMVAKQMHQILTKNDWKDDGVRRTCVSIRKYQSSLGYSEEWMTEYVHTIVMLAKKEPKKNSEQ